MFNLRRSTPFLMPNNRDVVSHPANAWANGSKRHTSEHNARCSEWMSHTLDFAFFLPLIGSIVYTSVYLHGDRAAPIHQYPHRWRWSHVWWKSRRLSSQSKRRHRQRNMMAMLCILKCDYDVRPTICRGTYVAINKLVTKSYKLIFKRMMT